jgi:hypothetical protein
MARASSPLSVGFDVRPDRVVVNDFLANGGGLYICDLLWGERRTGISIDTSFLGVIGLIIVAAFIILANSGIVDYNKGGQG